MSSIRSQSDNPSILPRPSVTFRSDSQESEVDYLVRQSLSSPPAPQGSGLSSSHSYNAGASSSLTSSSSGKHPSSGASGSSSSSAQPQSNEKSSGSGSSSSGQSYGKGSSGRSSSSGGGASGTFNRDLQTDSAILDETPYLDSQSGPTNDAPAHCNSAATTISQSLLDDSIFENIEDSDVEVESSQSKGVKSPGHSALPGVVKPSKADNVENHADDTIDYMDVDTQPSDQDTPELIHDFESAQSERCAEENSHVVPLQSPMKALSEHHPVSDDTEDEPLMEVGGVDCSLRLHFSQSQEYCANDEVKKGENTNKQSSQPDDSADKPEEEEEGQEGADGKGSIQGTENGKCNISTEEAVVKSDGVMNEEKLPLDGIAVRKELLYESLQYDEEDSVNLSCSLVKNHSGEEPPESPQNNPQRSSSQKSEVSQLTSSAGNHQLCLHMYTNTMSHVVFLIQGLRFSFNFLEAPF